jgi:hypothetical protein
VLFDFIYFARVQASGADEQSFNLTTFFDFNALQINTEFPF